MNNDITDLNLYIEDLKKQVDHYKNSNEVLKRDKLESFETIKSFGEKMGLLEKSFAEKVGLLEKGLQDSKKLNT